MKIVVFLLLMITLVGCMAAGYHPSYIISDVEDDSYVVEE